MQYIYNGEIYKIVRVTGPSHNLLGISFGDIADLSLNVEDLSVKTEGKEGILASNVQKQVISGINEINNELGTNFIAKKIQFMSSDTPSSTIYKELSKELVKRIESNGEFKRV